MPKAKPTNSEGQTNIAVQKYSMKMQKPENDLENSDCGGGQKRGTKYGEKQKQKKKNNTRHK